MVFIDRVPLRHLSNAYPAATASNDGSTSSCNIHQLGPKTCYIRQLSSSHRPGPQNWRNGGDDGLPVGRTRRGQLPHHPAEVHPHHSLSLPPRRRPPNAFVREGQATPGDDSKATCISGGLEDLNPQRRTGNRTYTYGQTGWRNLEVVEQHDKTE